MRLAPLLVATLILAGCGRSQPATSADSAGTMSTTTTSAADVESQPAPLKRTFSKAELAKSLLGKTRGDVLALLGKPDDDNDLGGGKTMFLYWLQSSPHDFTVHDDSMSGAPASVTVTFTPDNLVEAIDY